jgi:hypothetical protein
MYAVLGGLIFVTALDQGIKAGLRRLLGSRAISFGVGELRVVSAPLRSGERMSTLWGTWTIVVVPLAVLCTIVTPMSWPGGLVIGASLSHLIEMSRRGTVCRYLCVRGRSAFNLADVAIKVGGAALAFTFSRALYTSW